MTLKKNTVIFFYAKCDAIQNFWGEHCRRPEIRKKGFPDPERVNPEIPSLKTPDPGVPIKVLSPLTINRRNIYD